MSTQQAPKRPRKQDKLIGTNLAGKYKIIKKIGEGGMGSVYIANQEPIDRKVAVKVLLGKLAEDEIAVKRFEQEARAISKMQHPNTVTIYDFGHTIDEGEEERLYIVMEYLKGNTLTQVLRNDGPLPGVRAARIMRQVCASLADAHTAGIIHRDLKPDNIFLTEIGGDKDWVKVLDFGVAKLADSEGAGTLTQTGMIFGTPKYMSPEQAEGRPIDYRADIYAIGVVLYELLVGRPPFVADTPVGLLLKHISEPPPSFAKVRPDLPVDPRIEAIVMKALDKRPERRQQMVAELAADLEMFERTASGPISMVTGQGTYPHSVGGHLPTEVVPGTLPGQPGTPADLQPPHAVPSHLSLGAAGATMGPSISGSTQGPGTGATAGASAQYRPADALPTAAQAPMHAASVQMTAQGLTHPVPATGGGVETLGGLHREISGRYPGSKEKPKTGLLFAGVGLIVAAGGLVIFMTLGDRETPVATRIDDSAAAQAALLEKAPPPPTAEPEVAAPTPEPEKAPPPEPDRSERARPAQRPGRTAPPPPPPPAAPSRTVTVNFESAPDRALVSLGGKQLGFTPFERDFPRDLDVLTFVFTKEGYEDTKQTVTPTQDRVVNARLEKMATAEKKPPPVRPPPTKVPPPTKANDPTTERVGDLKGF